MSKTICLSAGHNDDDPGAIGNGLKEADLTGEIVAGITKRLLAYDCTVLLVPRTDDLAARAAFANAHNADLYLSIHCNAGGGTGFESYAHDDAPAETLEIQATIHRTVMEYLERYEAVNRGLKTANFKVLRETRMPAVLLECLFVDHPDDAALLKDAAFIDGLSNQIAFSVVQAMGLQLKTDPCKNCQRVQELMVENADLRYRHQTALQRTRQAQVLLGGIS